MTTMIRWPLRNGFTAIVTIEGEAAPPIDPGQATLPMVDGPPPAVGAVGLSVDRSSVSTRVERASSSS